MKVLDIYFSVFAVIVALIAVAFILEGDALLALTFFGLYALAKNLK